MGYGFFGFDYYAGFSGALQQVGSNYYLSGSVFDTIKEQDGVLWKFDSNLDSLWAKRYNYQGYNVFRSCKPTSDGGLIIVGETNPNALHQDIWLVKVDSMGNVEWEKSYGGSKFEAGFSVDLTHDGGYIVGGYTESYGAGESDDYIIKVDSVGNYQWSKTYGTKYRDGAPYILQLEDSTYMAATVIGKFEYQGFYLNSRFRVMHLDKDGSILWNKEYGQPGYGETAFGIYKLNNGDYVIPGQRGGSTSLDGIKGTLLRINSQGDSLWYREYEYNPCNENDDYIRDAKPTKDGGFIMAGFISPTPSKCPGDTGTQDMWVIKLDSIGCPFPNCDTLVGVISLLPPVADVRVYPNPAQSYFYVTGVSQLPATVTLYDLYGREVINSKIESANEKISTEALLMGIYLYHIQSKNGIQSKGKLVVQRE